MWFRWRCFGVSGWLTLQLFQWYFLCFECFWTRPIVNVDSLYRKKRDSNGTLREFVSWKAPCWNHAETSRWVLCSSPLWSHISMMVNISLVIFTTRSMNLRFDYWLSIGITGWCVVSHGNYLVQDLHNLSFQIRAAASAV